LAGLNDPWSFNNLGSMAFHALLSDGTSRIFQANAAVPEPDSIHWLVGALLVRRLRRHSINRET
jgi:hypothetical protein